MRFYFDMCGLISIEIGKWWTLHLFIRDKEHWIWGHEVEEYDQLGDYYGLGPLFLFVAFN